MVRAAGTETAGSGVSRRARFVNDRLDVPVVDDGRIIERRVIAAQRDFVVNREAGRQQFAAAAANQVSTKSAPSQSGDHVIARTRCAFCAALVSER